jgi:FAD/FMN-containing dehydrogenase
MSGKNKDLKASLVNSGYTGDLYIPGDEGYEASLVRFAKNAQKRAGLVAFVKSAEDASLVVKLATSNSVPLVVRSGGHSTSGASSSEGGIVIDLSRHVNTVRVDVEKKLGYVGGGANWEAVDKETIKYGLATVGGTINHVGVGG